MHVQSVRTKYKSKIKQAGATFYRRTQVSTCSLKSGKFKSNCSEVTLKQGHCLLFKIGKEILCMAYAPVRDNKSQWWLI